MEGIGLGEKDEMLGGIDALRLIAFPVCWSESHHGAGSGGS